LYTFSPSGKRVVPNTGPLNAEIVIVSDSPSIDILPSSAERLLNKGLVHVGIDCGKCRIINCVPTRAPGDNFSRHDIKDIDWGRELFRQEISQLTKAKVFITLGPTPLEWLLGGKPPVIKWNAEREDKGFISAWRGSLISTQRIGEHCNTPEDYLTLIDLKPIPQRGYIVPTFHPTAILRQFNWHPWFLMDLAKAAIVGKGKAITLATSRRKWYRNDPVALMALANSDVNLISYDTEIDPPIVGIATEDEVHVFEYDERYRIPLRKLLTSPKILKVAHNWLHDYAFTRKVLEIDVEPPIFDTVGGAMALNGALQKQLSPHISTRFTNWPYHKWLANIDQLHYCGMDAVVTYDSYWPMLQQLGNKGLVTIAGITKPDEKPPMSIVDYDHKLLMPLMKMQERGFRIDEAERIKVEKELDNQLVIDSDKLSKMVAPIVKAEIKRFKKPHLFQVPRKCNCCGGGVKQRQHCFVCSGMYIEPNESYKDTIKRIAKELDWTQKQVAENAKYCFTCGGTGKVIKSLPFNPDSPDQVADVIYRGLHIRPRKYKGVETIKAAQLDAIRDKHPIINSVVELSEVRADYDTVARLKAGADGLLHCEFDPWGTESGRIAGKEGLIEYGTNPMNLPKKARRFVIPRDGYEFIYPDMAQVEARAMAVLSKDANLHKALYDVIPDLGKPDYHTWLQRAIRDYDDKCNISRDQSKRVSYAGFYGARPEQLATELTAEAFRKGDGQSISTEMAARILQVLYKVCPEVPRWQSHVCDEVLRTRQLVSPTGRVFHWVGYIKDRKSGELEREIKKQAWSRIPQDIGAFVLGQGLIDMYYNSGEWDKLLGPRIHCHDALLIEVPKDRITEGKALAIKLLSRYIWSMDFPAEVKNKPGINWAEVS
jgi:uracil-DNA glycosylase